MSYSEMLRKIENGEITPIKVDRNKIHEDMVKILGTPTNLQPELIGNEHFKSIVTNAINVALNLVERLNKMNIPESWKDMTLRSLTNLSQKMWSNGNEQSLHLGPALDMTRWLLKYAPQDATTLVMNISWNAELSAGIRAGSKKITVSVEDCESFSSMFEMAQQMMEMWSDGHEKISFEIA